MAAFRGRLVGLIAMLALSITQAHSVWALCCLMETDSAVEHLAVQHHDTAAHRPASVPPGHAPTPDCPLGPAGSMGGCVVAAALPNAAAPAAGLPPELRQAVIPTTSIPFLLLGNDLFRPPRA